MAKQRNNGKKFYWVWTIFQLEHLNWPQVPAIRWKIVQAFGKTIDNFRTEAKNGFIHIHRMLNILQKWLIMTARDIFVRNQFFVYQRSQQKMIVNLIEILLIVR